MTIDVMKALPKDSKKSLLLPNLARSREPVKRSLFGEVNHQESMAFLQKELNSIQENQSRRWNFDFVQEKPIISATSNYEWQSVQPTDEIPRAYALSRLPFLAANAVDHKESESSVDVCHGVCETTHERLQSTESGPKADVTPKGLVQRTMLDFLTTKKRPASTPAYTDAPKSSDSSYHPEKRIRRLL